MRVDPAGNREQAAGGELLRPRHRAAELGDPAAGYADVSGFPVTGRDHGRAAYNEVKAHRSIVARGPQTGTVSRSSVGAPWFLVMPGFLVEWTRPWRPSPGRPS